MIAWGFVGIRIVLPARLKLPVPGSDHKDFTTDILLGQSNLQVDANKTWDGWKDQNCSQDYKSFPLLTTIKSVIINDSHWAKKTCISVIGDHPGFDSDGDTDQCKRFQTQTKSKLDLCMWWQILEKVFRSKQLRYGCEALGKGWTYTWIH